MSEGDATVAGATAGRATCPGRGVCYAPVRSPRGRTYPQHLAITRGDSRPHAPMAERSGATLLRGDARPAMSENTRRSGRRSPVAPRRGLPVAILSGDRADACRGRALRGVSRRGPGHGGRICGTRPQAGLDEVREQYRTAAGHLASPALFVPVAWQQHVARTWKRSRRRLPTASSRRD
jgi:hypothetical protein